MPKKEALGEFTNLRGGGLARNRGGVFEGGGEVDTPMHTMTAIEPETQNRLSTLKPGDTFRIRTDQERTWDKKGLVITQK